MKLVYRVILFLLINLTILNAQLDSITITKIKKTVDKEELIAKAYKDYLVQYGKLPTITDLINNNFLPKGFSSINPFGKEIKISTTKSIIENSIPDTLKSNLYDYYYTSKYRNYTTEPLSTSSTNVKVNLDTKEKFIFDNVSNITTTNSAPTSKYYLDKGVLHWYDNTGAYKYSLGEELVLDSSVTILDTNGNFTDEFKTLTDNIRYPGQTIYQEKSGVVKDYLVTDSTAISLGDTDKGYGSTIVQFSRRAGGMIVNGDIYTWGNNANRITGINEDTYTGATASNRYPVINSLVKAKAMIIDDNSGDDNLDGNIDLDYVTDTNRNYYSSPMRPKFIDFFATVYHSTCGVSTNGELYCGGATGRQFNFGNQFTQTNNEGSSGREMLYRSTFFDGKTSSPKAKKVFANNQIWHILSEDGDIYRWGYDFSGFSGNGLNKWNMDINNNPINTSKIPEIISGTGTKFSDITYLLTIGYRKIGALSTENDIYIWGIEDNISDNGDCTETWEGKYFNLCSPTKIETSNSTITVATGVTDVESELNFVSLKGGLEAFVALNSNGNYYKIYQPKYKKIQVESLNKKIESYSTYDETTDTSILSIDLSSKLNGTTLEMNKGIVWVNGSNQLKGDYFTADNYNDDLFKNAIAKIKWKQIKVIQDDNGMCGIDINNQMYCWGIMSFYRDGTTDNDRIGNTFMMPLFNANLHDLDKDYLFVEGGESGYLTNMTSDTWATTNSDGKTGAYFIKYPTYIGGFNYEFEFK